MNILGALGVQAHHFSAFWKLRQHFRNPWLISCLRLGLIKLDYFPYQITKGNEKYVLLGRPRVGSSTDFFVLREVLAEETYRDVLALLPSRPLRLMDIGANLGATTIWLSRQRCVSEAFCFEPEPDSFRLLNFNLARNNCGHARAIRKAVGGRSRKARMVLIDATPGSASIYAAAGSRPESAGSAVEVIALSEWLRETSGPFDLLKMDCEGAEWEIVRNTTSAEFGRFGAVMAEIHNDPEGHEPVGRFAELIESRGFHTVRWDGKCQGLYFGVRAPEAKT